MEGSEVTLMYSLNGNRDELRQCTRILSCDAAQTLLSVVLTAWMGLLRPHGTVCSLLLAARQSSAVRFHLQECHNS